MPKALINDVNLYYEIHGDGFPLVWSHEFAGDYRSWKTQVEFFSSNYKVINYNARGYPPSDVPSDLDSYSQNLAVEDLRGLLNYLGIRQAHIGGLSMGGNVALNFGLNYPQMAKSLIVAGTGTGSSDPKSFRLKLKDFARRMESEGMAGMADYVRSSTRVQLRRKDLNGWKKFANQFFDHSNIGSSLTFRGVQGRRPSIFELESQLRTLKVPTLIMFGDEDEPCVDPGFFMKKCIQSSGIAVFPQSGHAINLEEPTLFNRTVKDFLTAVEAGKWAERDMGVKMGALE